MAGQGSAGNVIAALCSFFVPGLGQLVQGRLLIAAVQFVLACFLWFLRLMIFWIYLGLLGYFIYCSRYLPRVIGILLVLVVFSWVNNAV